MALAGLLFQNTYGGFFWIFVTGNTFFQLNLVFVADSRTNFCSKLLWKHQLNLRSSNWNSSVEKGVHRNFVSFTGKHLCWSLFLIDLQAFRPAALLKRNSNTDVFLWNLQNSEERLVSGLRTTPSETCFFTWTALFNNLEVIHKSISSKIADFFR